jgi:hypothetical protein
VAAVVVGEMAQQELLQAAQVAQVQEMDKAHQIQVQL